MKKFSANAAKKCIVLEYILGGGSAKKEEAPKGPAKEGKKDVGAAAVKVATPSKYDNVPGITQEMVQVCVPLSLSRARALSLSLSLSLSLVPLAPHSQLPLP